MRIFSWILAAAAAGFTIAQSPWCTGKRDGGYVNGCSSNYIVCSNQLDIPLNCGPAEGLAYDQTRGKCEKSFRVPACGGHPEAQGPAVTLSPKNVPTYRPPRRAGLLTIGISGRVLTPVEHFANTPCGEVVDGHIANGPCEETYTICVGSVPQRAACRSGEVFDDEIGFCAPKELVQSCRHPSVFHRHSEPEQERFPDCAQLPEGAIFPNCANRYFVCSSGQAIENQCPGDLVYDADKQYCEYADSCGVDFVPEGSRMNAQGHGSHEIEHVDDSFDAIAPMPQRALEVVQLPIDCSHRADGNYGFRCWLNFTSCSNGRGYIMDCPSRLVFDPSTGYCDYPSMNGCVGVPVTLPPELDTQTRPMPTHEPKPVEQDFGGYQPAVEPFVPAPAAYGQVTETTTALPTTTTTLPPTTLAYGTTAPPFDCSDKIDGTYTDGCSNVYYVCSYGGVMVRNCPEGLVFSPTMLRCEQPGDCMMQTTAQPAVPTEIPSTVLPPHPVETTAAPSESTYSYYKPASIETKPPVYYPPVIVETTAAPECHRGETRSVYQCAFEFERCRNGRWQTARCPRGSMFDQTMRLCVFNTRDCHQVPSHISTEKPTTFQPPAPVTTPVFTYGTTQTPYQPAYQTDSPTYQPAYPTETASYSPSTPSTDAPTVRPPYQTDAPTFRPPYQTDAPTYPPVYQTDAPTYRPPYETEAPTFRPPYETEAPTFRPPYQTDAPTYPPVYQTDAPTYPPVYQTDAPTYRPPYETDAPTFRPPYQTEAPTFLPPYETDAPTFRPPYQTEAPTFRPPYETDAPTFRPPYQTDSPTYKPIYQTAAPPVYPSQGSIYEAAQPEYLPQQSAYQAPQMEYSQAQSTYGSVQYQQQQPVYGVFGEGPVAAPSFYGHHYYDDDWEEEHVKKHVPYRRRSPIVKKARTWDDTFKGRKERIIASDIFDVFRKGNPIQTTRRTTTPRPTTVSQAIKFKLLAKTGATTVGEAVPAPDQFTEVSTDGPSLVSEPTTPEESLSTTEATPMPEPPSTTTPAFEEPISTEEYETLEDDTDDVSERAHYSEDEAIEGSGDSNEEGDDNGERDEGETLIRRRRLRRSVPQQPLARLCAGGRGLVALSSECHENFVYCMDANMPVHAACPEGEVFSPELHVCVESCETRDVPPTADSGSMMSADAEEYRPIEMHDKSQVLSPEGILDACHGRADGAMGLGCSKDYVVCSNEKSIEHVCPDPLVFDERTGSCDYEAQVVACGAEEPTPVSSTFSTVVASAPAADLVVSEVGVCAGRSDGFYALDCLGSYVSCNAEASLNLKCSEGLVFDEELIRCERVEDVARCSGRKMEEPSVLLTDGHDVSVSVERVPTVVELNADCAGREDGQYGSEACSPTFLVCEGGRMAASLICPLGTWYHPERKTCELHDDVPGCADEGQSAEPAPDVVPQQDGEQDYIPPHAVEEELIAPHPVEEEHIAPHPVEEEHIAPHPVEEEHQQYLPPHQVEQSTTADYLIAAAVDEVTESIVVTDHVAEPEAPVEVDGACAKPIEAVDDCSPKYRSCHQGQYHEQSCSEGLVYSETIGACDYPHNVLACEGRIAVPAVEEQTTEEPAQEHVIVSEDATETPRSCAYDEAQPNFATGYCQQEYGICLPSGVINTASCPSGHLFDVSLVRCVLAFECGTHRMKELFEKMVTKAPAAVGMDSAESLSTEQPAVRSRCHGISDGVSQPMGKCRSSYVVCFDGFATIRHCSSSKDVFSISLGFCVPRSSSPECASLPGADSNQRKGMSSAATISDSPASGRFCATRQDGLYRDPSECSAILQCMAGDLFEYPPCAGGLVFSEKQQSCDFRENVPECSIQRDIQHATTRGCERTEHGAFKPHESDCSLYYRCVWTRLELMNCPAGTVFNPNLDVCDWADNVPQCAGRQ